MGKWIAFLLALALLLAVIAILFFSIAVPLKESKPVPMVEVKIDRLKINF